MSTDLLLLINLFDLYIEDKYKFTIYYNANIVSNYNSLNTAMERYLQQLGNESYYCYKFSIKVVIRENYWQICRIKFKTNFNLL